MKKVLLLLTITLSVLFTIAVSIGVMPYFIYKSILAKGIKTSYLEMDKLEYPVHAGEIIDFPADPIAHTDSNLWHRFHFGDFNLKLPKKHPSYYIIPIVDWELGNKNIRLGLDFKDTQRLTMASIKFLDNLPFKVPINDSPLFALPIFAKKISEVPGRTIWKDMFTKDLTISKEGKGLFRDLFTFVGKIPQYAYEDLVYNIFIQHLRIKYFSNEFTSIKYDEIQDCGIAELIDVDPRYAKERYFYLRDGVIYSFLLRYKKSESLAAKTRDHLLDGIYFQKDEEASADSTYNVYRSLKYHERIGQEGMMLLFVAWSHVRERPDFLQEMIRFLERGKSNSYYLEPLYKYAFKKYGTNFSSRKEEIEELLNNKVTRMIGEEVGKEALRAKKKYQMEVEGVFETKEERADFYLRRAKDSKADDDVAEDRLEDE